ncbi:MAG: hypothetical protein H0W93_01800, partial [Gammaproteobacteria bacterium]|nr:hypothetical protein [Gammaproteobacteria bacterium]
MTARLAVLLMALSSMLSVSCGGGGGTLAGGGIGGTGISNGTVTAFGSIFVNGIEFDTSQAQFTRGGQPATESDFNVGEVVTVTGTFDENGRTGVAQQVMYESVVNGVVTNVPAIDDGEIEVLGQPVIITPANVFFNFLGVSEL